MTESHTAWLCPTCAVTHPSTMRMEIWLEPDAHQAFHCGACHRGWMAFWHQGRAAWDYERHFSPANPAQMQETPAECVP